MATYTSTCGGSAKDVREKHKNLKDYRKKKERKRDLKQSLSTQSITVTWVLLLLQT